MWKKYSIGLMLKQKNVCTLNTPGQNSSTASVKMRQSDTAAVEEIRRNVADEKTLSRIGQRLDTVMNML